MSRAGEVERPPRSGAVGGVDLSLGALASVYLLDSLSYSLMLPLLPFILEGYAAGAIEGGALIATHALFTALSGPLLGGLSDRIGRKQVIAGTVLGAAASYLIFGMSRSLTMLFVARALAGAMAGNLGVIRAAAADRSSIDSRAKVMGVINAAGAMGFVLGPALGALIGPRGNATTWWVGLVGGAAAGLALTMVLVCYREARQAPSPPVPDGFSPGRSRPFALDGWRWQLLGLIGVAAMAEAGLVSVTPFLASLALAWTPRQVGILFLWVAIFIVVTQLTVVPRLAKAAGDRRALVLALTLCAGVLVALVLASHSVTVLVIGAPLLFFGITAIQTVCLSCLSKIAEPTERGTLLGVASSASSAGRILGPALCGVLFVRAGPTAPYGLMAAAIGAWLLWLSFGHQAKALGRGPSRRPVRGEDAGDD